MAVTNTSTPAKFSWADIVKGSTTPTPPAGLRPAARGEKGCYCHGEILVMLGHYGWIMAFGEIDHPDVGKTSGRVYVHKSDVVDDVPLAQGDTVSFYLYADEQGLGAESCELEKTASTILRADTDDRGALPVPKATSFEAAMNERATAQPGSTPGWNICAAEFVPTTAYPISSGLSVEAAEFVPSQFSSMNPSVQEFIPASKCFSVAASNVITINPAFLSDDESDDEHSVAGSDDFSGNDADKESIDSDKDSSCDESMASFLQDRDFDSGSDIDVVVLHAPLKSPQASSLADSTSVGALSDSEEERTVHCAVRAPPGLSLPKGWRPPPGLSLPVAVA